MKKNNTNDINQFNLKTQVLSWVNTLRVHPNKMCFYFGEKLDYNLFSSCFALFIYDLYKITESFTEEICGVPPKPVTRQNKLYKGTDA